MQIGPDKIEFSDHFLVIIEFDFNIKLRKPIWKYTWRFNERKYDEYCNAIVKNMEQWNIYYEELKHIPEKVHDLTEVFQLYIHDAAYTTLGIKMFNSESIPCMSRKERATRKKWKKAKNRLKNLVKHKSDKTREIRDTKNRINKLWKQIKQLRKEGLREDMLNKEDRINDAAVDNSKEFYRLHAQANKQETRQIGPLKDEKGTYVTAKEVSERLLLHFNEPLIENKYEQRHLDWHNEFKKWNVKYKPNKNDPNSILNKPFDSREVINLLSNLNLNSAMAHDMMHYKLLNIAKYELAPYIVKLFNLIYIEHQTYPNCWRNSPIKPFTKPGRDPSKCGSIRPITVPPRVANVLERGVNDRMTMVLAKENKLRKTNNAFQKNKQTTDLLVKIAENVNRAKENKSFVELIFTDVKSAYDSTNIDGLLWKMYHNLGWDGNILAFWRSYLKRRYNRVEYDGHITKWEKSRECLAQGGCGSPTLWNIYFNLKTK